MDKELKDMMTWFKSEKLKDENAVSKAKVAFIDEIKRVPKTKIGNTEQVEKKYTLWQRLKQTLKMN